MTLRVLLADDHKMLREGIKRGLEDEGFDVVGEASNGVEAVKKALDLEPDVVLMDVSMPELDGVEAARRIILATPEQKVVMLTMHADREVIRKALEVGAVGYLTKDCSTDEVVEAVRLAVNGETVLSRQLAATMLLEARRSDGDLDADRLISPREEEVLQLIADGCSPVEVAKRLYISQKTVKNHLASIYEKLNARDRTQAVLTAVRMGIVKLR